MLKKARWVVVIVLVAAWFAFGSARESADSAQRDMSRASKDVAQPHAYDNDARPTWPRDRPGDAPPRRPGFAAARGERDETEPQPARSIGVDAYGPDAGGPTMDAPLRRTSAQELFTRWEQESDDAEWTRNQRAIAQSMLEMFGASPTALQEVSCRTTVCRISLKLDASLPGLIALYSRVEDEQYPVTLHILGDGSHAVAYVAREGLEEEVLQRQAH